MFQSLAGSPSTSHVERVTDSLNALIVSIPGGKPLHEPRRLATMHHRHDTSFQSLAGSPSTSHTVRVFLFGVRVIGFNPWREAPPRATPQYQSVSFGPCRSFNPWREAPPRATALHSARMSNFVLFQSLAGSPSTSHGIALSEDE